MALSFLSTGQAQPNHYNLGRGIVYAGTRDATTGLPLEFRDLGNCTEFNVSLSKEQLDHFSSRSGLKVIDKAVVLSQSMALSFTLDEMNFDNLALFLSGSRTTRSAPNLDYTALAPNSNVWLAASNHKGRWYDLYEGLDLSAAYPPAADPMTKRVYNVSSTGLVVTVHGGAALTLNTDYVLDNVMGRLFIMPNSGVAAGAKLDVKFKTIHTSALTVEEVSGLSQSSVQVALKFISENASYNSAKVQYQFHKVTLSSSGDLGLISDQYSTMKFEGKAEKDELVDANFPVMRVSSFAQ